MFFISCGSGVIKSGELTFSLNESAVEKLSQKAARLADSNEENLSFRICVTLEVDKETLEQETFFNPNKEKKSDEDNKITFPDIEVGKKAKASVSAYYEEIKLASGESEEITIKEGSNPLPVTLKFDEYTIDLLFKFRFLKDGDYVENADYPDEKLSVSINTFKDFENPDFSSEVQNQLEKLLSAGYLLNEEKTSDPEVKAGVYTYTLFLYRLSQADGKVFVEDDRIAITAEPDEVLYLNSGKVSVAARNAAGTALTQTDAKLFYGGREVPSDYYTYENGIFSINGEETKLLTSGTYQLFITADSTENGQLLTGSRTVNLDIQDKLYYECDIDGAEDPATAFEGLQNKIGKASADAIIKISGNPAPVSGYFAKVKDVLDYSFSPTYKVDLDMADVGDSLSSISSDDRIFNCDVLHSIKLSSHVLNIPADAFSDDEYLKTFSIEDDGNQERVISPGAFNNCNSLEKFEIVKVAEEVGPYQSIADGKLLITAGEGGNKIVQAVAQIDTLDLSDTESYPDINEICELAFNNTKIKTLVLPSRVTKVGNRAFMNCTNLQNVTLDALPDNISSTENTVSYEQAVFNYANTKNLTINFDITTENYTKACNYLSSVYSNGSSRYGFSNIENIVFNGEAYFTDLSTNNSDKIMFKKSSDSLKSLTFNGKTYVGKYAFYYFDEIESVTFNDSTKSSSINENAFYYCSKLSNLSLDGVSSISEQSFYHCEALTEVSIPDCKLEGSFKPAAFDGCIGITKFVIADNDEYKTNAAGTFITDIEGETIVMGAAGISSVDFTGIKYIGDRAFFGSEKLKEIEWGNTLISIGSNAFYDCGCTQINLPASVIAIGPYAFARGGYEEELVIQTFTLANKENWYSVYNDYSHGYYKDIWPSWRETKPTVETLVSNGTLITDDVDATIKAVVAVRNGNSSNWFYRHVSE